ncbi:MAG: hypothetical protein QW290_09675 [Sulfolobales archaeon]
MFRLKAENATTSLITVTYSYRTLWEYVVLEPLKTLGSITITKIPVSLTISAEPREVTVGEGFVVSGKLIRLDTGAGLAGKKVELYINGSKTSETTSNATGDYSFKIRIESVGRYTLGVYFSGDGFLPSEVVTTVVVGVPRASAITWSVVAIALGILGLGICLYMYRRRRTRW